MTRKLLLTQICPIEYTTDACVLVGCEHCNVKLNGLLDEYDKHVIEQYKASTDLKDTIKDIHDNVAQEMYCKGVDDFTSRMLEELKALREQKCNKSVYLARKSIDKIDAVNKGYADGYNKAIDDLMEKVSECFISDADWNYLVQVAEQLKAGAKNE